MSEKYEIQIIRILYYLAGGFFALFGGILVILTISDVGGEMIVLGTDITGTKTAIIIGIGVGIVILILAYIFWKAGSEIGKETSKGWKMVMAIEGFFLISGMVTVDPFMVIPSAVIMYYLWVTRRIFGITKDQKIVRMSRPDERKARKICGFIANFMAMPGYGQVIVGRTRLGVKLYLGFIVSLICMVMVSAIMIGIFSSVKLMLISGIGFFVLFFVIYFYALYDIIVGDVVAFEGSILETEDLIDSHV